MAVQVPVKPDMSLSEIEPSTTGYKDGYLSHLVKETLYWVLVHLNTFH